MKDPEGDNDSDSESSSEFNEWSTDIEGSDISGVEDEAEDNDGDDDNEDEAIITAKFVRTYCNTLHASAHNNPLKLYVGCVTPNSTLNPAMRYISNLHMASRCAKNQSLACCVTRGMTRSNVCIVTTASFKRRRS